MSVSSKRILSIDSLESRAVPAQATLSAGTLAVISGQAADIITVQEAGGNIKVVGTPIMHNGVLKASVPAGLVTRVFVNSGRGNDVIDISTVTKRGTIIGGFGSDSITGGLGIDDIYGREGNDSIFGGGGNDKLYGEADDDTVWGDDGNDTLFGGIGDDVLAGRGGDDLLYCEAGNDLGSGGDGKDKVLGNIGDDSLFGGLGNDDLKGEDGNDEINGDDGNDSLDGGNGNDTITGFLGDDEIYGMAGNDSIDGGDGADSIYGGAGNDKANGGAANDLLKGEIGDDTLHGDAGNDIVGGGLGDDFVFGDDGDDIVAANIVGDIVNGGLGNDTIVAGPGDVVDGGGGTDTVISGGGGDNNGGNETPNQDSPASAFNNVVHVFQTVRNQWNNGATIDITIRNLTATTINALKIEFDADFNIYEQWSAQFLGEQGNHFTFQNNAGTTIGPNQQFTFGFNVNLASGVSRAISNIEFNDQALTTGAPNLPNPNPNTLGTVTPAVRAQWPNGATIDVTVRNTGNTAINGWTIEFDADFELSPVNVWNAQLFSRNGNHYTIRNIPNFWNTSIAPNTQITFGFNLTLDAGDSATLSNITLNGNAV